MKRQFLLPSKNGSLWLVLFVFAALNIALWQHTHKIQAKWANVPPPPAKNAAAAGFLGDQQMAYRSLAVSLQNFGNEGGRFTPLKDYNYNHIADWLNLLSSMDTRSKYAPFLASYYFGATQNPEDLKPVTEYLAKVGSSGEAQQWRWLAQAMYLARFRMNNLPLALEYAEQLSAMYKKGMPGWTKQAPALVRTAMGDKEGAYNVMMGILKSDAVDSMHPNEVNYMLDFICNRALTQAQAEFEPVCKIKRIPVNK